MRILFVCYANACRSQMAEAYARYRVAGHAAIQSAGLIAAGVWPQAVEAMDEWGISLDGQTSKRLEDIDLHEFDLIVSFADRARRACDRGVRPGARRVHVPVLDPAGVRGTPEQVHDAFRMAREDIAREVDRILGEMLDPRVLRPIPEARRPDDPLADPA